MTQHIGIACSAEGAALCYRTLCAEGALAMGPHDHPEISMHTHPLARYVERLDQDDWAGVGELMLDSGEKLAQIGADFLICPDNTIHNALPFIAARSPLPWLHIADAVGLEAQARGFSRLGLTGTAWLVDSPLYPDTLAQHSLECVRPPRADRDAIHQIIMDELVYGQFKPASVTLFQQVITRLKNERCDAVILGCTEIPLIISDENSVLPTLDSTRLLARAALKRAIGEAAA